MNQFVGMYWQIETYPKKPGQGQKLTTKKNPQFLSYHHETWSK